MDCARGSAFVPDESFIAGVEFVGGSAARAGAGRLARRPTSARRLLDEAAGPALGPGWTGARH